MNIKKLRELKKNKKGFTLIEIIVVIVILAVLMAVAVPAVLNYMGEADDAKYMAAARAQMTDAQVQLAKDYVAAPDKDAWTIGSATLTKIDVTPEITDVEALPVDGKSPDKLTAIEVTFSGGTKATVTINDKVEITPAP